MVEGASQGRALQHRGARSRIQPEPLLVGEELPRRATTAPGNPPVTCTLSVAGVAFRATGAHAKYVQKVLATRDRALDRERKDAAAKLRDAQKTVRALKKKKA